MDEVESERREKLWKLVAKENLQFNLGVLSVITFVYVLYGFIFTFSLSLLIF